MRLGRLTVSYLLRMSRHHIDAMPARELDDSGDPRSVQILGVRVHCVDLATILRMVVSWIEHRAPRTILYVNAHCLNVASVDPDYRGLLNQADLVYPDGAGAAWAGRWLGDCQMRRATGADWIEQLCALAVQHRWRLAILAGQPGVAERASSRLRERYLGLRIVSTGDGYFATRSEQAMLEEINQAAPDILLVGMGTPRQERWLANHRSELQVPVCWAVGALFDYVAGLERRAPTWMRALALEWLWRLLVDPVGKWRRYLVGLPLFVWRLAWQKWTTR
jgi:N-acetylglucosaminyldiphosphoundecaprenol N-acetyl-beta-D-mannosaminyltransferase